MLMVLLVHYNGGMHGKLSVEMYQSSVWQFIGCASLNSVVFVCVDCFIIISGYFGIRWKWKGLLNLLFQIAFWSGLVYGICAALGYHDFEGGVFLKRITLFLFGTNWFFIAYLGLYLMAPVLNAFISHCEERELGRMLLAFYFFQTLFGWFTQEAVEINAGMSMVSFMGLYLTGAYVKRSSLACFKWSAWKNLSLFFAIGALCVVISVVAASVGINKSIYSYISPLQIVQTIYMFLFCRALTIRRFEKVILFFSSSAFAAFLMHYPWADGQWLYNSGLHWIYDHIEWPFFAVCVYILGFFAIACCLDKVRAWCWNRIMKRIF